MMKQRKHVHRWVPVQSTMHLTSALTMVVCDCGEVGWTW